MNLVRFGPRGQEKPGILAAEARIMNGPRPDHGVHRAPALDLAGEPSVHYNVVHKVPQ